MGAYNNPFVGAAGDAARGATSASGALAAALTSAASQQAQHQQIQQQQASELELKLRDKGYTPLSATTQDYVAPGKNSPGQLGRRTPEQNVDPSRIYTDQFNRKWVQPPDKPDATPQQSYTDLAGALNNHGREAKEANASRAGWAAPDSKAGQGDDPSRVATIPGTNRKIYFPTDDENSARTLRDHLNQAHATADANSWILPDAVADRLAKVAGLPEGSLRGQKLPHEVVDTAFKAGIVPDNPKAIIPGWAGPNGEPIERDPRTGETSLVKVPPGSRAALTPAQMEAKNRADQARQDRQDRISAANETKAQSGRDAAQKQIDVYQKQEKAQQDLRGAYGKAVSVANGQPTVDPKSGRTMLMTPALRDNWTQKYNAATEEAQRLQAVQQRIVTKHGGDASQPADQPAGSAPKPAAQAQPQAGQGRGKLTDPAIANDYVRKAKGNKAVARKLAAKDGWSF